MKREESQAAPETLEIVRTFLNTWRIPNDTRTPTDLFVSPSAMAHFYKTWFGGELDSAEVTIIAQQVYQLRADLRQILGTGEVQVLSEWLMRYPVHVTFSSDPQELPQLRYKSATSEGCILCAVVIALVIEAIAKGTWMRLKACPDCQWVFYDATKNRNKVWCLMVASGSQGRSCGSIAKVQRFRQRRKEKAPNVSEGG